jgi:hypothetical protein
VAGASGAVDLVASEVQFITGALGLTVVQPVLQLYALPGSTSTGSADSEFSVRPYTLDAAGTSLLRNQPVSPAGSISVSLTSTNAGVGRLVTSAIPGGASNVTVAIQPGQYGSPSSVAAGGVAFHPVLEGTTGVSATASGFANFSSATQAVTVSP